MEFVHRIHGTVANIRDIEKGAVEKAWRMPGNQNGTNRHQCQNVPVRASPSSEPAAIVKVVGRVT